MMSFVHPMAQGIMSVAVLGVAGSGKKLDDSDWPTTTDRWFVYVLLCERDGSFYCGASPDPTKRLHEHRVGRGAKYVRGRGPLTPVIEWRCDGKSEALKMEARFKKLNKAQKRAIIESRKAP